jgi:hypothetical protein
VAGTTRQYDTPNKETDFSDFSVEEGSAQTSYLMTCRGMKFGIFLLKEIA